MKVKILVVIAILFTYVNLPAQQNFELSKSTMTVSGTSTLHDWVSDVTEVNTTGTIELTDGVLKNISSFKVTIPVKGIVSSKGKIMDNKTYKALKSDEHPNITFLLQSTEKLVKTSEGYSMLANGYLTIAGTKKSVKLNVTANVTPDGEVTFKGSKSIKMTDYGMEPPTALMGTISTGDEVTIDFSVTLSRIKS